MYQIDVLHPCIHGHKQEGMKDHRDSQVLYTSTTNNCDARRNMCNHSGFLEQAVKHGIREMPVLAALLTLRHKKFRGALPWVYMFHKF